MSSRKDERSATDWDPLSALLDAEQEELNNPFAKSSKNGIEPDAVQTEAPRTEGFGFNSSWTSVGSQSNGIGKSGPTSPKVSNAPQQLSPPPPLPRAASPFSRDDIFTKLKETPTPESPAGSEITEPSPVVVDTSEVLGFSLEEAEQPLVNMQNVAYVSPNNEEILGTLRVTNYRLHFKPLPQTANESRHWFFQNGDIFDLPLGAVDKITRSQVSQSSGRGRDSVLISILCKDFRKLQFKFASLGDAVKIHDLVKISAFPVSEGQGFKWIFALEHGKQFLKGKRVPTPGWNVYNPIQEWIRQGVFESEASTIDSTHWRLAELNMDYQLCPTYPRLMVVPKTVTDQDLHYVAGFRSKGRIPALTYYNKKNRASIWRCSQPKVGIGNTCRHDEVFWSSVIARSDSNAARIVDCRSFKSALGNKARGMGYEDELRYEKTTISFMSIQNIHVVRSSFEKLHALVSSSYSSGSSSSNTAPGYNWLNSVEGTGWLNHIRSILSAALVVARHNVVNGSPVLVHCSDGWDRTAQVVALAQLMIDPYFRTMDGFRVLVEKDWLSFGYKFMERTGQGSDATGDEKSPCFLQFIDCVWQLLHQFPTIFEFNEAFLISILDHLYSCKFGTFLCDSESERLRHFAVHQKTVSVWDYVESKRELFTNILYSAESQEQKKPLLPHQSVLTRQVELWQKYYLRYAGAPSMNEHAFSHLRPEFQQSLPSFQDLMLDLLVKERAKSLALEEKIISLRDSVTHLTMRNASELPASTNGENVD